MITPRWYISLAAFRADKNIQKDVDDSKIKRYIRQASALWDLWTGRQFVPVSATKKVGRQAVMGLQLLLVDDLLELSSLTNGDDTTIEADSYKLRPDNSYPKNMVELTERSGLAWTFPYREDRVLMTGLWGYCADYANAWAEADSVQNTPSLSASATQLVVTDGSHFEVLQYLLVENEQMLVTAISTHTLTVQRGVNGTTAAAHATDTPVSIYQQLDDVQFAVGEVTKWLYEHRDRVDTGVQLAEGLGVVIVRELPEVREMAKRYTRKIGYVRKA